jgi:hypothetical protein
MSGGGTFATVAAYGLQRTKKLLKRARPQKIVALLNTWPK